eukprot:c2045_g1_i1.p1 GENE.c2045_g1_i1~~c2045_g1_i1.p1  ORF type:complete len:442 (-),score=75.13 c2045_g1_i1:674-1960(-)
MRNGGGRANSRQKLKQLMSPVELTSNAPRDNKEFFDSDDMIEKKAKIVADMLRIQNHVVVHTGAGISTAASIPDFRGPQGVWTVAQPNATWSQTGAFAFEEKQPTFTHLALSELVRRKIVKHIVSQNVDGLHCRSGVPLEQLSELHGNVFIEVCTACQIQYLREFQVIDPDSTDNKTGRKCDKCDGDLVDTLIDFEDGLPREQLKTAIKQSELADMSFVLGTSLSVAPACDLPRKTSQRGGQLVIVNLQKTTLDVISNLRVFAKCDLFMQLVMQYLDFQIPKYIPQRKFVIVHTTRPAAENFVEWTLSVSGECGFEIKELLRFDIFALGSRQFQFSSYSQGDLFTLQIPQNIFPLQLLLLIFFRSELSFFPVILQQEIQKTNAVSVHVTSVPLQSCESKILEDVELLHPVTAIPAIRTTEPQEVISCC